MRKTTILGLILLVVIGVPAFALLNLSSLVNRNKDYLLAQAEQSLGRKITAGEIEVNVWNGIGIRLKDFALADDPAFSPEACLRAADLQVNARFLPLLWRQLEIKRLILHRPLITVLRNRHGVLNFASLGKTGGQGTAEPAQGEASSSSSSFSWLVAFVNIVDGEVRYVDQQHGTNLRLRHIDSALKNLSVDEPVSFRLEMAALAEQQNIEIKGKIGPLGTGPDFTQAPIEGKIKIAALDLDTLQQAFPQLKKSLPQGLTPTRLLSARIVVAGTANALMLSKMELTAAVLAERQNVTLSGHLGPLGPGFAVASAPLAGKLTFDAVNLDALQRAFPQLQASLPQGLDLSGPVDASLSVSGTPTALAFSDVNIEAGVFGASTPNLHVTGGRIGPFGEKTQAPALTGDLKLASVALEKLRRFAPLAALLPPDLQAQGPLVVDARVEGTTDNFTFTGTVEATDSVLTLGDRFHKPEGIPLVISTDARVTPKAIALQRTKVRFHTLELTGNGEVTVGQMPVLNLTLDSNRVDLNGWDKLIPPLRRYGLSGSLEVHAKTQGEIGKGRTPKIDGTLTLTDVRATLPSVPKPLTGLNATMTFTGNRAELTETVARLGDAEVRLAATVERFAPLALTYRLSTPELQLADLQADGSAQATPAVLRGVESSGRVAVDNGALTYQGKISSGQGTIGQIPYTNLRTALSLIGEVLTIESLTADAFQGALQANGRYDLRAASPAFTFASRMDDIDLTQVFRSGLVTAAQDLEGRLDWQLQLTGSGKQWADIQRTLRGQGRAEVVDGVLRKINIADGVLSGVTGIPGLSLLISPRMRQRYPEIFATGDTQFDQLKGEITIGEGTVKIDNLLMAASDWKAQGKGWFAFDRTLDFHAQLVMSEKFSDDIVAEVKQAKYILNQDERLEVPFALAGTLPGVRPRPDVAYVGELMQRAVVRRGTEELQKRVLDKLLPPRRELLPDDYGDGPPPERAEPRRTPAEELLQRGLEGLFKRR